MRWPGAKGSAHDNAVAENFFCNLNNERVHHRVLDLGETARAALFSYIEIFYSRKRLHQTLGYQMPLEFKQRSVEWRFLNSVR